MINQWILGSIFRQTMTKPYMVYSKIFHMLLITVLKFGSVQSEAQDSTSICFVLNGISDVKPVGIHLPYRLEQKPLRVAEEELRVTELGLVEFGEQLHISNPHIAVRNIKHLQLHKVSERCVNLPPTNGSLIRK